MTTNRAKPFVKWAGGKGRLTPDLDRLLPCDFQSWKGATYVEPFVGGGAMLFYMLQSYANIEKVVINDINSELIACYTAVRDCPNQLIAALEKLQMEYYSLTDSDARKALYLDKRTLFNAKPADKVNVAALFIFLNRTCFNGLYRVNRAGKFNVPAGVYERPIICDRDTILADSELLRRTTILQGDFEATVDTAIAQCAEDRHRTLVYLDPPYRPLNSTSNFNDYAACPFDDCEQRRLKACCNRLTAAECSLMLSNSDCAAATPADPFFDNLYAGYHITRVMAARNINANGAKRGKIPEIVVRNYLRTKAMAEELFPTPQANEHKPETRLRDVSLPTERDESDTPLLHRLR